MNGANMETSLTQHPPNFNTAAIAYAIDTVPTVTGVTRTQVFDAIRAKELTAGSTGGERSLKPTNYAAGSRLFQPAADL
jgi:hypothetical protein